MTGNRKERAFLLSPVTCHRLRLLTCHLLPVTVFRLALGARASGNLHLVAVLGDRAARELDAVLNQNLDDWSVRNRIVRISSSISFLISA